MVTSKYKRGLHGLPSRSGRIRAVSVRINSLGELSISQLSRSIKRYERLSEYCTAELNVLNFKLSETGFRLNLFGSLNAKRYRTRCRLDSAKHFLHKKQLAIYLAKNPHLAARNRPVRDHTKNSLVSLSL